MLPARIVIGTRNRGKVREIARILAPLNLEIVSLEAYPGAPEVEETGSTFAENACLKALALAEFTGEAVLADDSGLEVDALGGLPGVRSARFAGENCDSRANNEKLLREMENVPDGKRAARFRCAVCLAGPSGKIASAEGSTEGTILRMPRGSGGFGYDPLFFSEDLGMSFAEAPADSKNAVSHRARALEALRERFR